MTSKIQALREELRTAEPTLSNRDVAVFSATLALCKMRERVISADLRAHTKIDVANVSRAVGKLIAAGLIEQNRDPLNRRAYRITLTPKGKTYAEDRKQPALQGVDDL